MEQKKRIYWLLQFFGWGGYHLIALGLAVVASGISFTANLWFWIAASFLFSVFLAHLLRGIILYFKLSRLRFLELVLSTAIFVLMMAISLELFQYFLDIVIVQNFTQSPDMIFKWSEFFMSTIHSCMLFGTWAFFYYVYLLKSAKANSHDLVSDTAKKTLES